MDARFIEPLEGRRFLSAGVTGGEGDADVLTTAAVETDRRPRGDTVVLIGTWRGTALFNDGDSDSLKVTFSRFDGGRFIGKITSLEDSSLFLKIKARFTQGRSFRFTFDGSSSGGQISGQGNAALNADGSRFTGRISGSTGGEAWGGSITFRRR